MMHKMKFATYKSHYVVALFLLASITAALYLTATTQNRGILRQQESKKQHHLPSPSPPPPQTLHNEDQEKTTYEQTVVNDTKLPTCDLFSGRWVFDNDSNAMYGDEQCSFMLGDYACEKYGRKDLRYRNWRWQPHHCDIPR